MRAAVPGSAAMESSSVPLSTAVGAGGAEAPPAPLPGCLTGIVTLEPNRPDEADGGAGPISGISTSPAGALRRATGERFGPHRLRAFFLPHRWAFLVAVLAVEIIALT